MNRGVGGKPRAGKTKSMAIWIKERLRTTRRAIVTNMAIELHPWVDGKGVAHRGLLRTLKDEYGETFDAERRIYFLKHEEVKRFYAIRPRIPKEESEPREVLIVPKGDAWFFDGNKYRGVDYVIDEAHVYFPSQSVNAKAASLEDPELLQWATQAGREGDEAFFLSQNLVWISVRLRGTMQECWWLENHAHLSWSMFRRPDRITRQVYSSTPPKDGEMPMRTETLFYDKASINGIYDTGKGVGVSGEVEADIGQRAKGLHWGFIPAGIVGMGVVALLLLWGFKGVVTAAFHKQQSGARAAATVHGSNQVASLLAVESASISNLWRAIGSLTNKVAVSAPAPGPAVREADTVVGWTKGSAGFACVLLDGTVFSAQRLEDGGRELLIDGRIYKKGRGAEQKISEPKSLGMRRQ